ncbi:hypothetical protein RYX36_017079 [Vicia faba]
MLNFDLVCEFYGNAMSIEGVCYTYCSFVRGRDVPFDINVVIQYLGNPLTLPRGELCAYQKRVASKKWRLDLVGDTLAVTPNHGFFLNVSGQPVHFKRVNINIMAQLFPTLLLYNIKPRIHTSTVLIDTVFLLYFMIKGCQIDVAQIILNEIRKIASIGHTHGNKTTMTL